MPITYDIAKDAINRVKHGLALADAAGLEMADAIVIEDDRYDYGETRLRAFGRIDGVPPLSRLYDPRRRYPCDQLPPRP